MDNEQPSKSRTDQALLMLSIFAFLGTSSAWVRVSAIQIRGLDYAFGYLPAFTALFIGWKVLSHSAGNFGNHENPQRSAKISILLTALSLFLICGVGFKVRQVSQELQANTVKNGSIWGRAIFRLLNSALSLPSNSIQKSITPKFAEGFFVTLLSFTMILVILIFKFKTLMVDEGKNQIQS